MNTTIRGLRYDFDVHGDGSPVVMLHGFPLSRALWSPCAAALGESHRVILPDLRGMGATEASDAATIDDYADDVAALLDHLGQTRPITLAGHSMGGYIAMAFARRHRDRLGALILVDTQAGPDSDEKKRDRAQTADRVLAEGSGVVANDKMLGVLFAPGAPRALQSQWLDIMAATDPRGVAAALRAMAGRPDSTPDLAQWDMPALIVVGVHDALTPPAKARQMHETIAGSQLAVVPGAGHMTPVEAPDRFTQIVRTFLDSLT
jgi:pimeloyl-ACP methyl ester carboxylesterase